MNAALASNSPVLYSYQGWGWLYRIGTLLKDRHEAAFMHHDSNKHSTLKHFAALEGLTKELPQAGHALEKARNEGAC